MCYNLKETALRFALFEARGFHMEVWRSQANLYHGVAKLFKLPEPPTTEVKVAYSNNYLWPRAKTEGRFF